MTNGSGVATLTVPYHIGPNAYMAKVGVNQTIISSTVMLPITWAAAAIALFAKGFTQSLLLIKDWYDSARMLAVALVNFIIGLMALKVSIGVAFINALFNLVYGGTVPTLYVLQNKLTVAAELFQHIRTWVDYAEMIMDFAFGITALVRYLDLTGAI